MTMETEREILTEVGVGAETGQETDIRDRDRAPAPDHVTVAGGHEIPGVGPEVVQGIIKDRAETGAEAGVTTVGGLEVTQVESECFHPGPHPSA